MVSLSHALRNFKAKGFIVSSSEWSDIDRAFNVIKAYLKLRKSKILSIGYGLNEDDKRVIELRNLGVKVESIGFRELVNEYDKVSRDDALPLARKIVNNADNVVEPSMDEIVDSIRLYIALRRLLERNKADGIAIDCLAGYSRGDLPVYPCLAFMLLDDEGTYVTACENDLDSLVTKLVMKWIANRPGFICEPVMDTSKNLAIYAHCVAPTKMSGYENASEPFVIRSHAEDDKGVSIQVLFRANVPVTITKIVLEEKRILLLKGTLLGHLERNLGCRSKAIVKVSDAQRLIDEWQHGWHRVLYYGDWTREIIWFAKIMGYSVHWELD